MYYEREDSILYTPNTPRMQSRSDHTSYTPAKTKQSLACSDRLDQGSFAGASPYPGIHRVISRTPRRRVTASQKLPHWRSAAPSSCIGTASLQYQTSKPCCLALRATNSTQSANHHHKLTQPTNAIFIGYGVAGLSIIWTAISYDYSTPKLVSIRTTILVSVTGGFLIHVR